MSCESHVNKSHDWPMRHENQLLKKRMKAIDERSLDTNQSLLLHIEAFISERILRLDFMKIDVPIHQGLIVVE